MNQTPGYGHHQNYPAHSDALKKKLMPGVIVASVAALVAVIGAALPFISASDGRITETESIFSLAFSDGRTIAGVLFVVGVILLFAPLLGAYFKPAAVQTKRAGFTSIAGGVVGIITILLMMFVFEQEGGGTISETISDLQDWGVDAGFGIGVYLTAAAFIAGIVGGVLFLLKAGPVDHALQAEQAAAMQQAPMGQSYQQGGQAPYQQGGQAPYQQGGPAAPYQQGEPQQGAPQDGANARYASSAGSAPGGDQVPPQGPPSPNHPHDPQADRQDPTQGQPPHTQQ